MKNQVIGYSLAQLIRGRWDKYSQGWRGCALRYSVPKSPLAGAFMKQFRYVEIVGNLLYQYRTYVPH